MSTLALGCRFLLIGVFAVSAATKLRTGAAFRGFAGSLVDLRLVTARWSRPTALGVVGAELAVLALLSVPATGAAGPLAAVALLAALSGGLAWSLRRGATAPCRCFGASRRPLGRAHLARNAALLVVGALSVIARGPAPEPAAVALALFFAGLGLLSVLFFDDLVALFEGGS